MTQPRPTAAELVDAVRAFLAEEVVADLDGRKAFHAKVAVNVLDTVARELRDGPVAGAAERARLLELLAYEADDPASGLGADPASTEALSRELARRIRDGEVALDDARLLDHLKRTAAGDVDVANPRWR